LNIDPLGVVPTLEEIEKVRRHVVREMLREKEEKEKKERLEQTKRELELAKQMLVEGKEEQDPPGEGS